MTSTAATIDVLLRANTAAYRAEMVRSARETADRLGAIRKEAAQTAVSIANLNRAAAGFVGFEAVRAGVSALLDAQKSIQQIHYGLQGATGSAAAADKAYGFVTQTAKELGLNLEDAAKSFTRMTAAASANGIGMRDQQELFRQLSRSATVMHLSSDEMGRATTALGQSFSKGKFQAEELRQQLGEAIPGIVPRFMQAVAKMNEGTALAGKSFDKLLQDGDLSVQKYLPAMIQALRETGSGAEEAAKGLNAELNRLSTAWFKLKADTSGGVFSDAAVTSVRLMAENLDKVAGAATIAAGVIAGRLVGAGARTAYGAVSAPITDRLATAGQAAEVANLARERAKEAAAQVEQARASTRLVTMWQAQAAAGQETARSELAVAYAAHEAAQRTLEHQAGAAALSANLRAQREAQAASVVAQRNLARAQAEYNAAVASGTRADAAAVAAKGRLIAAQEAATVATNSLAAARAKEAAAGAATSLGGILASGARSAGAGALALAGGPWGAAVIAIGAMGVAYSELNQRSEQARQEFSEQIKSLSTLKVVIEDTTAQYARMDGTKSLRSTVEEWNQYGVVVRKAEADIAALQKRISDLQAQSAAASTSSSTFGLSGGALVYEYDKQIAEAQDQLRLLTAETAPARNAFLALEGQLRKSMDPKLFEQMREAALRADSAEFNKLRAKLDDTHRAALDVWIAIENIGRSGNDDIWGRQVARLKREQGEYQSWLATEAKKLMTATGTNNFQAAWKVLTPEQQKDFIKRREFVKQDVAAEKAWNEQQKANRAATREATADSKAQESQYTSIIDRIQRQIALDKEQMGITDDMTAAQKLQVVVNNEMASAKSKLSEKEQKRVRTLLDEAVAQGKALAVQQSAAKATQDALRLQKELNEAARTRDQSNYIDLQGFGRGSDAIEQMRRQLQIQEDYQQRIAALNDRDSSAHYSLESYLKQYQEIQNARDADLAREAEYQDARKAYMADWSLGAARAFEDYAAEAANSSKQAYDLFSDVFTGLEDSIVNFVKTGKLSFSDLADSIIEDLARIAAKQAITGLVGAIGQAFGPTITGFDDGGFTGWGGKKQPAGVVHKGEVVWSQRDIARAGGVSVVEALRLGLRGYADGGYVGGGVALAPGGGANVQVIVENNTNAQAQVSESTGADGTKLIRVLIDQVVGEVDKRIGGMGSTGKVISQRFGMNPKGVTRG